LEVLLVVWGKCGAVVPKLCGNRLGVWGWRDEVEIHRMVFISIVIYFTRGASLGGGKSILYITQTSLEKSCGREYFLGRSSTGTAQVKIS